MAGKEKKKDEELIFKPSERLRKMRQEIIHLLIECKWDIVEEKYFDAIKKNEKIKKLFDEYLVDFVVNPLS
jgi:hypothetical protein